MKKKNLKSLKLNKRSITNLEHHVNGGAVLASDSPGSCDHTGCSCVQTCALTCPAWCDIPTINDSCFSWCDDKCNDF